MEYLEKDGKLIVSLESCSDELVEGIGEVQGKTIDKLFISYNTIDVHMAKLITDVLMECDIHSLYLCGNHIEDEETMKMFYGLIQNKSIKYFSFGYVPYGGTFLKGISYLAHLLKTNTTLLSLILTHSLESDEDLKKIEQALETNTTLIRLVPRNNNAKKLLERNVKLHFEKHGKYLIQF